MADEEGLRKEAIRRYLGGDGAAAIAAELGRTERWVFKWLSRYEDGAADWFQSASRAPTARPARTPEETRSLILAARDRLEADPRAQRGAAAIIWQLASMGVPEQDLPGRWTIERVIKGAGRSRPRQRTKDRYVPKGTPYPFRPSRVGPGGLHEIDPVGPRYLDGGVEVHSLNVMDVGSHRVALEPLAHPTPKAYAGHLLRAWERLGLPEVAQFDNHPSLRGDIGNGRVFGAVVRACLALGVIVRYVPLREPWRNGAVEHFQDVFDKSFFRTERFTDLHHLKRRAAAFESLHNATHHYSTLKGRTPDQAWAEAKLLAPLPPAGFTIPQRLPRRGRIEVVRFIRSDEDLNLFGEHIQLPERTVYQYVVATISIRNPTPRCHLFRRDRPRSPPQGAMTERCPAGSTKRPTERCPAGIHQGRITERCPAGHDLRRRGARGPSAPSSTTHGRAACTCSRSVTAATAHSSLRADARRRRPCL